MVDYTPLLEVLLLIVLAKVLGEVFSRISLPRVIGELLAGIILGPSILAVVAPTEELEILSTIGVVFFMLSAGLEIDLERLMKHFREGLLVAVFGVAVPFLLGFILGYLYGYGLVTSFCLGTCLSITAIGLSIRTLMDLNMLNTRVGLTIVNAAVDDDVIGLVLMSIATALAIEEEAVSYHRVVTSAITAVAFIIASFMIVHYLGTRLRSVVSRYFRATSSKLVLAISLALLFGLVARASSLHEIIGVFIAGMLLRNVLGKEVEKEILDFTLAFFALLFFSYIGVKTDIGSILEITEVAIALIAFAFIGKIIGGVIGGTLSGLSLPEALVVGIAMNSRAAVELAIANMLYTVGVLSLELFSAIVLMAAVTSIATPLMLKFTTTLLWDKLSRVQC